MKIGFFSDNFPPRLGGVATYSFQLPYFLKELRPEIKVEVTVFDRQSVVSEPLDAPKLTINRFPKQSLINLGWVIFRAIRKGNFDVVHATTFFPVGFFVALFAKIFRIKSCLTVYGTEVVTSRGSWITKFVKRVTLMMFDYIAAFSLSTKQVMLDKYHLNPGKVSVIYPCISPLSASSIYDARKNFGFLESDFVVLFVGRLVERKGALDLIKAIDQIEDTGVKLLFVGGGDKGLLENYVRENNLGQRVFFAGSVPHEEILNYYQAAQVFSMPSFFEPKEEDIEGLGIVYLEAQISGLPVLGTSSGGIPEAISDGQTGFVVPPRDLAALAQKISLLKEDKNLYQAMSQQAGVFVRENFSWEKNIDQHLNLYQK